MRRGDWIVVVMQAARPDHVMSFHTYDEAGRYALVEIGRRLGEEYAAGRDGRAIGARALIAPVLRVIASSERGGIGDEMTGASRG